MAAGRQHGVCPPPESRAHRTPCWTSTATTYSRPWLINTGIMAEPAAIRRVFKARRHEHLQSTLAWAHAYTYMHTRARAGAVSDAFLRGGI